MQRLDARVDQRLRGLPSSFKTGGYRLRPIEHGEDELAHSQLPMSDIGIGMGLFFRARMGYCALLSVTDRLRVAP